MNKDKLIKVSNLIGLTSIVALVYWVFIFIIITVFGLKVFRENITESFYLSIIGILALMFGALMINIMFNLTKISDYVSQKDNKDITSKRSIVKWIFITSFPIILGLLFLGDYISSHKKERVITKAAKFTTNKYKNKIDLLFNYEYNEKYIKLSNDIVDFLSKTDESIQQLNIIVQDTIEGENVFLLLGNIYLNKDGLDKKIEHVYKSSQIEKEYMNQVFSGKSDEIRFDSHDGEYELYYPIKSKSKTIILYYTEHQRYGKLGS